VGVVARRAKDYQVTSKTARSKLIPREKPYYRQLAPRVTLGYIRRVSGPGSWVRRESIGPGKFVRRTLGTADVDQRAVFSPPGAFNGCYGVTFGLGRLRRSVRR